MDKNNCECPADMLSSSESDHVECELPPLFRQELPEIVSGLVESCQEMESLHHLNLVGLPSREVVIEIVEGLKKVLFPGYFGEREVDSYNLAYQIGIEINGLFDLLSRQITLSIRHECRRHQMVCTSCSERGQKEALVLFKKLKGLRRILADDVRAAYQGDPAAKSFDEIIFSYPSIMAITTYRLAHELYVQEVPLIPRMMTEYAHSVTGIDIHPGAAVGRHFFIDHGTGVVIGETSIIGEHVRIYQGVTLGALSLPMEEKGDALRKMKRHPTIEDHVTIYAGATILGGETVVGGGSVIGGNVWLTHSVPPGVTVMIESPQLKYKEEKKVSSDRRGL
ncbi:MAG TPA: serine O-acetyltransferase EpsC [Thermodesulfobacteriota bacterium]|nr:serine O-acetyltransferase EpsC [Thermodesulfobacteriota bacterium]